MTDSPPDDPVAPLIGRPSLTGIGWPLLLAFAAWMIAASTGTRVGEVSTTTAGAVVLLLLGLLAAGSGVLVLLRTPNAAPSIAYVRLAAVVAAILALTPLDRPAAGSPLTAFLLTAPWRYALTPVVVHFALAVAWPHRTRVWFGFALGWYVLHFAMFAAAVMGLATSEATLLAVADHTFRAAILEPAGAALAIVAMVVALAIPDRRAAQRRAIGWALAAIVLGLLPTVLQSHFPDLGLPLDGGMTPARLALALLALLGVGGVLALPFVNPVNRDLLAHQLAARLLDDKGLQDALRELAERLRTTFEAEGVIVRLETPPMQVTAGTMRGAPMPVTLAPEAETVDDRRVVVAPIGRSGDPLGEVRLEARAAGAFGRREREWLTAFLVPIGAVLRARRREALSDDRMSGYARRIVQSAESLSAANEALPAPPIDDGMAVPPSVDAREVLGQLGEGVAGIVRHGQTLGELTGDARQRAAHASDQLAHALDGLASLGAELRRLGTHGDEIAASNETVRGIAFRTNLLANNAALEATRAGGAGRTFGVLAEEIRRLADSTGDTSAEIADRTAALASDARNIEDALGTVRMALSIAIRDSEATEDAARLLADTAAHLESAARSLRPAVDEANAVAKRRSARDHHLSATLERFLDDRATLARALVQHREALQRLSTALQQLGQQGGAKTRPIGTLGHRG